MTGWAPSALATPTPIRPIGPGPITTTPSPAMIPPITSRPYIAVPAVTISVASASRHFVRDMHHGVDVVDRVFGEAAIGAEPVGAMALGAKAVVEARGVHALAAALAAAAPGMDLDGDAVADWNSSTVGPSFTTVPIYSWPGVKPLLNGNSPSIIAGRP